MLKKAKKILTGIIASAMVLSCAGCGTGKSTAYALTVDGYQVKAGVYIYYQYTAFQEAKRQGFFTVGRRQNNNSLR
mgnify:CR=1 FL=1